MYPLPSEQERVSTFITKLCARHLTTLRPHQHSTCNEPFRHATNLSNLAMCIKYQFSCWSPFPKSIFEVNIVQPNQVAVTHLDQSSFGIEYRVKRGLILPSNDLDTVDFYHCNGASHRKPRCRASRIVDGGYADRRVNEFCLHDRRCLQRVRSFRDYYLQCAQDFSDAVNNRDNDPPAYLKLLRDETCRKLAEAHNLWIEYYHYHEHCPTRRVADPHFSLAINLDNPTYPRYSDSQRLGHDPRTVQEQLPYGRES